MWFKPTKRHIFIATASVGIAAIFGCAQEHLDIPSRVEKRVPATVAEPEEVKVEVVLKDEPAVPHAASVAPTDAQPAYQTTSVPAAADAAASAPDMLSSVGYSGAPITGPGYGVGRSPGSVLGGGADVPYGAGAWGSGIGGGIGGLGGIGGGIGGYGGGIGGYGGGIGGIGGIGGWDGGIGGFGGIGGWDNGIGGFGGWDGGIGGWDDGFGPFDDGFGPCDDFGGPAFGLGLPFLATELIVIRDDDHHRRRRHHHHRDDEDEDDTPTP